MIGIWAAALLAAATPSLSAPPAGGARAHEADPPPAGSQAVPPQATAELARLRVLWGDVAEADVVEGNRIEYVPYTGRILLGQEALAALTAGPDNVGGAALRFVLAHEAWHSVQWRRLARDTLKGKREDRTLECEADFMAAAEGYRAAERSGMDAAARQSAREGIERYVRAKSTGAGYSPRYPSPEMRATTIAMGWHHAEAPGLIRRTGGGSPGETDMAVAAWACQRIAGVSDASVGGLKLDWADVQDESNGSRTQRLKARNDGRRPISFSLLLVGLHQWRSPGGDGREGTTHDRIYQVIEDEITIAAGGSVEKRYTFDVPLSQVPRDAGAYDWVFVTRPYAYGSSHASLISARYADTPARPGFCYDKAARLPRAEDRVLLARLATVALAAREDFHPIAGRELGEDVTGRQIAIAGGLGDGSRDMLKVSEDRADVFIAGFRGSRAGAEAEFARLSALFASLCGETALGEVRPVGNDGSKVVKIDRLAPYAAATLHLGVYDNYATPGTQEGSVFFVISRNSGW